jgi:hypothetical protein
MERTFFVSHVQDGTAFLLKFKNTVVPAEINTVTKKRRAIFNAMANNYGAHGKWILSYLKNEI